MKQINLKIIWKYLQRSYQQLADEKRLHVVEFKSENGNYPVVLASPAQVRKPKEVPSNEPLDFTQYIMGNRVVLKKKKLPPFFTKLPSYKNRLVKLERTRNSDETGIQLLAKYGKVHSFLTEKYPEAQLLYKRKSREDETVE